MEIKSERSNLLDSWRGFLCIWVVLSHIFSSNNVNILILSAPGYAVDGFIFLSGYFIRQSCQKFNRNTGVLKPFFISRFMRIWPTYAIIFSSIFIINYTFKLSNYDSNIAALTVYFTNLFLINGFFSDLITSFIIPSWSLCLEMQFYIFFPLIYIYKLDKNWLFLILSFFITVVSPHFLINQFHFGYYFNYGLPSILPLRIFHFMVGVLWFNSSKEEFNYKILLSVFILIFIINPFTSFLYTIIYISTRYNIFSNSSYIKRILELLSFTGKISFSLYLIHNPVLYYYNYILTDKFFYNFDYKLITTIIAVMGGSIFISYLIYQYLEIKFMEIGRKWLAKA
jgi:peptidoglycan/LPS O-acetylase OafA/YrhL